MDTMKANGRIPPYFSDKKTIKITAYFLISFRSIFHTVTGHLKINLTFIISVFNCSNFNTNRNPVLSRSAGLLDYVFL